MQLPLDFLELLAVFAEQKVRYLLIGGYAVGFHHRPRATKDMDLWLDIDPENLQRAAKALEIFGAPQITLDSLRSAKPDDIVWMGNPPSRIDLLLQVPGGHFSEAYGRRVIVQWDDTPVNIISKEDLLSLKLASARPQDLVDAEHLRPEKPK